MLASLGPPRPLSVLVEIGYPGGRAGARDQETAAAVASAALAARHLELVGVEFYEGLIPGGDDVGETLGLIDAWLELVAGLVERLLEAGQLPEEPLLSGGGSAYFDRVVARFGAGPGRLVLRSGCYVTQDGGFYADISPLAGRAAGPPSLHDALELWSTVLSRPEPERAIAGFGKRDAPWDMGWPLPRARRGADGAELPLPGAEIVGMNDQHAHVRLPAAVELEAGELLRCAVSHPCGAFDRWRAIPLVDDERRIVDAILTYF